MVSNGTVVHTVDVSVDVTDGVLWETVMDGNVCTVDVLRNGVGVVTVCV